jgi:glucosamine-6-phosphate deaminase
LPTQEVSTSLVTQDPYATLSLRVAELVREQIRKKPDSRLGLPTGRTPTGTYAALSQWTKQGDLNWEQVKTFGLDEYYDVDESVSFRRYLENNLYCNINLPSGSRFSPIFNDDYDGVIASHGGLDLTILGIGQNGHIAFNEPGTPLDSWTHSIWLTESTLQANAEFFKGRFPTNAVTMGIQTILASKNIILMASGKNKKEILAQALRGPVTPDVPASFLQLHKHVTVMTDFAY